MQTLLKKNAVIGMRMTGINITPKWNYARLLPTVITPSSIKFTTSLMTGGKTAERQVTNGLLAQTKMELIEDL